MVFRSQRRLQHDLLHSLNFSFVYEIHNYNQQQCNNNDGDEIFVFIRHNE